MIETVARQEVLELVEKLGHDPNRVASLTITPGYVTVEYLHPITEGPRD